MLPAKERAPATAELKNEAAVRTPVKESAPLNADFDESLAGAPMNESEPAGRFEIRREGVPANERAPASAFNARRDSVPAKESVPATLRGYVVPLVPGLTATV